MNARMLERAGASAKEFGWAIAEGEFAFLDFKIKQIKMYIFLFVGKRLSCRASRVD